MRVWYRYKNSFWGFPRHRNTFFRRSWRLNHRSVGHVPKIGVEHSTGGNAVKPVVVNNARFLKNIVSGRADNLLLRCLRRRLVFGKQQQPLLGKSPRRNTITSVHPLRRGPRIKCFLLENMHVVTNNRQRFGEPSPFPFSFGGFN